MDSETNRSLDDKHIVYDIEKVDNIGPYVDEESNERIISNIKNTCNTANNIFTSIKENLNKKIVGLEETKEKPVPFLYFDQPLENDQKDQVLNAITKCNGSVTSLVTSLANESHINLNSYKQLQNIINDLKTFYDDINHGAPKYYTNEVYDVLESLKNERDSIKKSFIENDPFCKLYWQFKDSFDSFKNDERTHIWFNKIDRLYIKYVDLSTTGMLTKFQHEFYRSQLQFRLIDLYSKFKKQNSNKASNTLFLSKAGALKQLNLNPPLVLDDGEINHAAYNEMKAKHPFSFAFNRMHYFLDYVDTDLKDEFGNLLLSKLFNEAENLKTFIATYKTKNKFFSDGNQRYSFPKLDHDEMKSQEAIFLHALEQMLLNAYFEIRKDHPNSRLADGIEEFLKSPYGLNLVAKYGIDIPHDPPYNMKTIDLIHGAHCEPAPKRVALVDISALVDKGNFDDKLLKKLKAEYDEVVLFSMSEQSEKVNEEVNRLQNHLNESDLDTLNVRAAMGNSPDKIYQKYLDGEVSHLGLNGQANIVTSIFQSEPQTLRSFAEFAETDHRAPNLYYMSKDNKGQSSKFSRFSKEEVNAIETDQEFDTQINKKPDLSQELAAALRQYIKTRTVEKNMNNSAYNTFFAMFTSSRSASVKIDAANKIIDHITYEAGDKKGPKPAGFSADEITAFNSDRLGKIIKDHYHLLPPYLKSLVVFPDKKSEYIFISRTLR